VLFIDRAGQYRAEWTKDLVDLYDRAFSMKRAESGRGKSVLTAMIVPITSV